MIFSIDDADRRGRAALIESNGSWTYGELAAEVSRRCERLQAPSKSLLFLFCRNDRDSVAWWLAALEAGHAVALLPDRMDAQYQQELLSLYAPDWVLSPADGGELRARKGGPASPLFPGLAVLLSTSGSTGSPKFVRLTRANIERNASAIRQALAITMEDVPVAHLPMSYSYGLSVLTSHLLAGASIVLTTAGLMMPAFWETLRAHRVNSFSGVPYTYQMLRRLGLEKLNVPTLRIMTQAGGKLDTGNIAHFHEELTRRNGSFWVMYGQTEATARISILPAPALPAKLGSAGVAIPGGQLTVETDDGRETGAAELEGELIYRGPNVMLGYALERSDLAKGDELGGRLATGDRARLDADGYVHILGRAKRDAKLFGLRVNLDDLEAFVKRHGPTAAIAAPGRVVFFCEFGAAEAHSAIRDALCSKLNIHHSAFEFRRVGALPVKDTGKVDYDALMGAL